MDKLNFLKNVFTSLLTAIIGLMLIILALFLFFIVLAPIVLLFSTIFVLAISFIWSLVGKWLLITMLIMVIIVYAKSIYDSEYKKDVDK